MINELQSHSKRFNVRKHIFGNTAMPVFFDKVPRQKVRKKIVQGTFFFNAA
ncbi:hypothetical protein Plhal710r2_c051g0158021 [Plasmopara halstedii]